MVLLAVAFVLIIGTGIAEEQTGASRQWGNTGEQTDASGQWMYVLEGSVATITGCVVEPEGDLSIPSELDGYTVTGIGANAFINSRSPSVTIPNSVTSIGDWAFSHCQMITAVIPDGVTSIGSAAFSDSNKLISVTLPDSLTSIGEGAFASCEELVSVTIPASVTSIGDDAFLILSEKEGFVPNGKVILSVEKSSFAEQYAKENGIPHVFVAQ